MVRRNQAGQEIFNDDWSIKRVIERRSGGPNFKHFAACDLNASQIAHLERLRQIHSTQPFNFKIYRGDANEKIDQMLHDAPLGEKVMPCFCLIDQRTMECDWETVRTIATFVSQGYKIEIFYFLAERWLDRTWRSIQDKEKLRRWWGRDDYEPFLERQSVDRAFALRDRFRSELGYKYAEPWSIHQHGGTGTTMFYMIHASDHPRARLLMSQAYHATPRVGLPRTSQASLFPGLLPGDGKI